MPHFFGGGGLSLPYPLGPMPSGVRRRERTDGDSSTSADRQSLADTALVNAPEYSEQSTYRIAPTHDGGMDGFDALAPTYRAYDKVVAVYTQPGYKAAAPWQDDQYPITHRPLIGHPPLGYGQSMLYYELEMTRPPVNQLDYNLGQITSDYAMGA